MSDDAIPITGSSDELIENLAINPQRARVLKEVCGRISAKTGISVRESELVNYLIDCGLPRLVISNEGLTIK